MSDPTDVEVMPVQVDNSVMLTAREKAEIDIAVATAKQYPRSIKKCLAMALDMATLNEYVAESCFYHLTRKSGRTGEVKVIEGPSIRAAEIMASAWGNLAVDTQITGEDEAFIYATATCRDLERNVTVRKQVRRRITDSFGKKYKEDMIGMTANAAASIAMRNAVLAVVPGAYTKQVYDAARATAMGDAETLEARRSKAMEYVRKMGASDDRIFAALTVAGVEDITLDKLVVLKGMCTAIKDGDTTVDAQFPPVVAQKPGQSQADALAQDMAEQAGTKQKPATAPETPGEAMEGPSGGKATPIALKSRKLKAAWEKPPITEFDVIACSDAKCANVKTNEETGEVVPITQCSTYAKNNGCKRAE